MSIELSKHRVTVDTAITSLTSEDATMGGKSLSRQSERGDWAWRTFGCCHEVILQSFTLFDICLLSCFWVAFHLTTSHPEPSPNPNTPAFRITHRGLSYWWISHVSLKFLMQKTEKRWLKCLGKMNLGNTQQNKVKVCNDRGGRRKEMALRWRNRICLSNADCNTRFRGGGHYELQGCMSWREQGLLKRSPTSFHWFLPSQAFTRKEHLVIQGQLWNWVPENVTREKVAS